MSRKLAAILALDVVGYSRLMSEDETGTHASLNALFSKVVNPSIDRHGGRIVKTMGDGLLAEFASAVEAVSAGALIQLDLADPATQESLGKQLTLRIGINLGDVIIQDDDIFGDGVNIATRLEAMADEGSILISGSIYDQVANKLEFGFEDLGSKQLKNIPNPIRTYRVNLAASDSKNSVLNGVKKPQSDFGRRSVGVGGLVLAVLVAFGIWQLSQEPMPDSINVAVKANSEMVGGIEASEERRVENPAIIVLPFDNMSDNREQEYFVDGITEDIITDLSHFSGLKVLARNASFQFKGKAVDPMEIGKELQVTHMLEGSVRRAGDQLRITAQLIDTRDGFHIWAQRYDKKLKDVFAVQDEVTLSIVNALALELSDDEQRDFGKSVPGNVQAYDYLQQGLAEFSKETKETSKRAEEFYRMAIESDPEYGRGYGALAVTLARSANRGWSENPKLDAERALELANTAVRLSPDLPQTHWAKAFVHISRKDFTEAKEAAEKTVTISPSYADGHGILALVENRLGNGEEALDHVEKGMSLNPFFSWDYLYNKGFALYNLERYEESANALEKALQRNENARNPRLYLIAVYSALGRQDDAEWEAEILAMQYTNISIKSIMFTNHVDDPVITNRFIKHLRQAGIPEN